MVEIAIYATRTEAELARTALSAAGISSVLATDDAGGAYPFDLSGGARVLVDQADAGVAAVILTDRSDAGEHERS